MMEGKKDNSWRAKAFKGIGKPPGSSPSSTYSRSSSERDMDLEHERRRKLKGKMIAPGKAPKKYEKQRVGKIEGDVKKSKESTSGRVKEQVAPETDLNKLSAKLVKAELMGNEQEVTRLRNLIEQVKAKPQVERVPLTFTDKEGRMRPISKESTPLSFADQREGVSLRELLRAEKNNDDGNFDREFASNVVKGDEDFDGDTIKLKKVKLDPQKDFQKKKQRAIRKESRMEQILRRCFYCMDSECFEVPFVISRGVFTYLRVPSKKPFIPYHCMITTLKHSLSLKEVDEDVFEEIKNFKKCLVKCFATQGLDCIFFETVTRLRSERHTIMHCVPLRPEFSELAPMYFKKAILDSDTAWSQNKKLIDTKAKGFRRSVPNGFPYFNVEFGNCNGYAHVIEDEEKFPKQFGEEILGGIVDVEPHTWKNAPIEQKFERDSRLRSFRLMWEPFDWTKMIP